MAGGGRPSVVAGVGGGAVRLCAAGGGLQSGCVCPSAGHRGEEDGAGAQPTEGEQSGGSPLPLPRSWGGVAAGAAGERLCAGGVRLPELRFRARGLRGRGERGCEGTERGLGSELSASLPPSVHQERPVPIRGKRVSRRAPGKRKRRPAGGDRSR